MCGDMLCVGICSVRGYALGHADRLSGVRMDTGAAGFHLTCCCVRSISSCVFQGYIQGYTCCCSLGTLTAVMLSNVIVETNVLCSYFKVD